MNKKYIIESINIYLLIIQIVTLLIGIITTQIVSIYKAVLSGLLIALIITSTIICYFTKKKVIYNIGVLLTILCNIIFFFFIIEINSKYDYIDNIKYNKYTYEIYNVYVQKRNPIYNEISKLENKKIGMLKENNNNIKERLASEISIKYKVYNNINELEKAIQNGEIQAFIIKEAIYNNIKEEGINLKDLTRSIYRTKIKTEK